jgi:BirA family biotin operon repressor/biotin-[acetyl-CoA-carboxylase] ligase
MRLGGALAFSMLWHFGKGMAELSGLSLVVGLAIARVLKRLGAPVALKWPNDVLFDGRKLAGVLIELSGEVQGPVAVVIGIGLNLADPGEVGQPVAGLAEAGIHIGRNELLATLLNELVVQLRRFDSEGFPAFQAEWHEHAAFLQHKVAITQAQGQPITGQCVGVDASGALLVETEAGPRAFHAGEVSLRVAQP